MFTEFNVSDDFTNAQPIEAFKLVNAILQQGENSFFNKQIYDLKHASLDPAFSPVLDPYT
jgi:hypothetical protein